MLEGRSERAWRERAAELALALHNQGIDDPRVLAAIERVPRQDFVCTELRDRAWDDRALSIGHGQTISQPYIVALMTQAARLTGAERVLEVGTGSGYQTAILAHTAGEVFSVETLPELARGARETLAALGLANVRVHEGDGSLGWPEAAPFDAILVTAAPQSVPEALKEQLASGGRLVIPIGAEDQELILIERDAQGFRRRSLLPVRFVPLVRRRR